MSAAIPFSNPRAYVDTHLEHVSHIQDAIKRRPSITISRQLGSRGITIGNVLTRLLQKEKKSYEKGWSVFDRNLVQKVLEDHNLPAKIEQYMPEDHVNELKSDLEELLGLHPSNWTLIHHTAETILKLARLGHVIIVGRGSNVITLGLSNVVRVRLIGSEAVRVARVCDKHEVTGHEAQEMIKKDDSARRAYVKENFDRDIDDAMTYDLVINTDRLSDEAVARIILEAVREKSQNL